MYIKSFRVLLLSLLLVISTSALSDAIGKAEVALSEGNYRKAMTLFTPLAENGNPDAMLGIGRIYANGWGVEKDQTEANSWYTKAMEEWSKRAQNGDAKAYASIGLLYSKGMGVEKDRGQARRLYKSAYMLAEPKARGGDIESQYLVGLLLSSKGMYRNNINKSVEWLGKAADAGHVKAAKILIHIYECNCRGIPKNDEQAEHWRGVLNANEAKASS